MEIRDIRNPVPTNGGWQYEKFKDLWNMQVQKLKEKFGDVVEQILMPLDHPIDVPVVFVKKDSLIEVLQFLKTDPKMEYQFLSDITATDETPLKPRFHVVYNLFSHTKLSRFRVKVCVEEGSSVPTAIFLWKGANWAEREVWDMFGIPFRGHPDLRRILMDSRWVGHPLRKDYDIHHYQVFPTPEPINPDLLK